MKFYFNPHAGLLLAVSGMFGDVARYLVLRGMDWTLYMTPAQLQVALGERLR